MTFRYFPYKDNPYHELRIAGGRGGGVGLSILKDRGNRCESITIPAGDVDAICDEIRRAAQNGGAR
jgi:hypothetical protein